MASPNDPPPQPPQRDQQPPQMPNRFSRSLLGWVIFIALGLLLVTVLSRGFDDRKPITTVQFWNYVENGQVTGKIVVRDDRIEGQIDNRKVAQEKDKSAKFFVNYNYAADKDFDVRLRAALAKHGYPAQPYYEPSSWWTNLLPQLLLMALVFLAVWFLLFRRMGAAAGGGGFLGSFGRSRHRVLTKERAKVTFDDVAGIDDAKEEVAEIIEFLKDPRKFQRLGGRVPRGVLLVGEPGCGKTLLAKAIAGEAEVPFFSISGSDFVEMFVGVGASRVRDLFRQAKESSPCIIFLDEIDAVGRRRGMGFNGGGHDEREQTLNAILVEMDGFDTSDQVIVIAATNRSDVLDPALTRPGRFDRQIQVSLPDLQGRCEILKIYAGKVRCGPDVDLHRLARGTPMFSGADLEALVNEAAIDATMSEKDFIEQADLEEARDKVRWGRARKSRVIDEREKEITAYHEAGHALVQLLTPDADPLHKVSIIPRGPMGGATYSLPEKDRYLYTRRYCKALLRVMLGGRVAEEEACQDVSSGAASDIAQATELAKKMILDWGMSDKLGMVRYAPEEKRAIFADFGGKEYSDKTAELIDLEIKQLVDEAYAETHKLIVQDRAKLDDLAKALLKYETLSAEEAKQIIEGRPLAKPTMDDLLDRERVRDLSSAGVTVRQPPPQPEPKTPPITEPG
ncbi:MAG TPA: ATP-dependent zinc metalloprotease FtsH [Phycisphaerae bacterium]|nr:ATP-dependent zinc metalloprotease FtsH [Phycisphaerae bacterium]